LGQTDAAGSTFASAASAVAEAAMDKKAGWRKLTNKAYVKTLK
jgi:hypothetical protein